MEIELRTKSGLVTETIRGEVKRTYKEGKVLGMINRKPFNRGMMGNFCPHWVRYKKKEYLLHGGIDSSYIQDKQIEAYIEVEL